MVCMFVIGFGLIFTKELLIKHVSLNEKYVLYYLFIFFFMPRGGGGRGGGV